MWQRNFSDEELERIIEEAMLYMCACPGQVAGEIRRLRELIAYQQSCEQQPDNVSAVHQCIARHAVEAHAQMEACLSEVLTLERWDRQTLRMPEGLRVRRDALLRGE
ncbi:hypothetical protein [Vogesella oryzae]|uniref:hypothetical protein n=1 Tax=Vogesella oryzae TaxID=1735285 RepID=UPI0015828AEF|nr:hypothetical protein [Vogesella oryzae]